MSWDSTTPENSAGPYMDVPTQFRINNRQLFSLAYYIYGKAELSQDILEEIEGAAAGGSLFFLINSHDYIQPRGFEPVPPSTIWEIVKNDTACIFRRRLYRDGRPNEAGNTVCAVYLGRDMLRNEVAAGIIIPEGVAIDSRREDMFYELIGNLKRFYNEFSASRVVDDFVRNKSAFRYVIDAVSKEIIFRKTSSAGDTDWESDVLDHYVTTYIFPGKAEPCRSADAAQEPCDDPIKNVNLARTIIQGREYVFLSFNVSRRNSNETHEYDRLVRNFSHKIRGKLTALQSAADKISMEKSKVTNDDDITPASIIQTATEGIDRLVSRLDQFSSSNMANRTAIDLGELIENILRRKRSGIKPIPTIEFIPYAKAGLVEGDPELMESALGELIENAVDACPSDGNISIGLGREDEKIKLTIHNDLPDTVPTTGIENFGNSAEPLIASDSRKAGMGLTIARRIIRGHGGEIEIAGDTKDRFTVTVELPAGHVEEPAANVGK
jgi:hypothetical protein